MSSILEELFEGRFRLVPIENSEQNDELCSLNQVREKIGLVQDCRFFVNVHMFLDEEFLGVVRTVIDDKLNCDVKIEPDDLEVSISSKIEEAACNSTYSLSFLAEPIEFNTMVCNEIEQVAKTVSIEFAKKERLNEHRRDKLGRSST